MRDAINILQIDNLLKERLISALNEFDSHRVGAVVKKIEVSSPKETKVIKMETEKKKASFLERLFMTEYA